MISVFFLMTAWSYIFSMYSILFDTILLTCSEMFRMLSNECIYVKHVCLYVHGISNIGISMVHSYPHSKVHGANMGPIWGRQDPGGTHVGTVSFFTWVSFLGFSMDCPHKFLSVIAEVQSKQPAHMVIIKSNNRYRIRLQPLVQSMEFTHPLPDCLPGDWITE